MVKNGSFLYELNIERCIIKHDFKGEKRMNQSIDDGNQQRLR